MKITLFSILAMALIYSFPGLAGGNGPDDVSPPTLVLPPPPSAPPTGYPGGTPGHTEADSPNCIVDSQGQCLPDLTFVEEPPVQSPTEPILPPSLRAEEPAIYPARDVERDLGANEIIAILAQDEISLNECTSVYASSQNSMTSGYFVASADFRNKCMNQPGFSNYLVSAADAFEVTEAGSIQPVFESRGIAGQLENILNQINSIGERTPADGDSGNGRRVRIENGVPVADEASEASTHFYGGTLTSHTTFTDLEAARNRARIVEESLRGDDEPEGRPDRTN